MIYKKQIIGGLLVLTLVVGIGGAVRAHEGEYETLQSTDSQTEEQLTDEQKAQKLRERIKARNDIVKVRLTEIQKIRLKNRCKPAQGLISRVEGRIKGVETSRHQVYDNLLDRLDKLVERLKSQSVDTAELEAQIVVLKSKIDTFQAQLADLKQAVSDLVVLECATDPDGFHVSLEVARGLGQTLRTSGADIKTYLNQTIKETLKQIRKQLAEQSQNNEEESE